MKHRSRIIPFIALPVLLFTPVSVGATPAPTGVAATSAPAGDQRLASLVALRTRLAAVSSDGSTAPVLWETVMRNNDGAPLAGAEVVAYVSDRSTNPAVGSAATTPVAWATSAADGSVVLRLEPESVAAYADDAGWVTLTYVIGANLGAARMWVDSVFVRTSAGLVTDLDQAADATDAVWESSNLAYVEALTDASGTEQATVADSSPAAVAREEASDQPPVLSVDAPKGSPSSNTTSTFRPRVQPPTPPTDCTVKRTVSMPAKQLAVTTMYLNRNWTSTFDYQDTSTTKVSVSMNAGLSAGGVGASTQIGSINVRNNESGIRMRWAAGQAAGTVSQQILAWYDFETQEWECRLQANTFQRRLVTYPTRPRLDLQPGSGTVRNPIVRSVPMPACNSNRRSVNPNGGFYYRTSGSTTAQQFSGSLDFSLGVGAASINFSIAPTTSVTFTTNAAQFWVNTASTTRWLCGLNSPSLESQTDVVARP